MKILNNFLLKSLLLACFFCAYATQNTVAQEYVEKFGRVSKEVLEMTSYEADKDAEAVVLFDVGSSYMTFDQVKFKFVLRHERHRRIKILKQGGTSYADAEVLYYTPENSRGDETVTGIKAYTYNLENGKIVETKMEKNAIFTEEVNKNYSKKKFTLPNVKVGSVIEYRYQFSSEYIYDYQSWIFQDNIPTLWSEYKAAIPEYYNYQIHLGGYENFEVSEKGSNSSFLTITSKERTSGFNGFVKTNYETDKINYQDITYRWAAKNLPAFKKEKGFITAPQDYLNKVEFELLSIQYPYQAPQYFSGSWNDIAKRLLEAENFGAELNRGGDVKDVAQSAMQQTTDKIQQVALLYNVAREVNWNGDYRVFASKNVKRILEEKVGNSADINLLLIALLRAVEIPAYPVVLSTRNHGRLRSFSPSILALNHVIVAVEIDDKNLLLDASAKNTPVGTLPYNCLNGTGILIKSQENTQTISLTPPKNTKTTCMVNLAFTPEGTLQGDATYYFNGYDAINYRAAFFDAKDEKEYINEVLAKNTLALKAQKVEVKDAKEISKPLTIKLDVATEEKLEGEVLYIEPFLEKVYAENPFTQESRKYPVDFAYPHQESYVFNLSIPANYKVEELPKNEKMVLPDNAGSFSCLIAQNEGKIQISCSFAINKTLFLGEEYAMLKEFAAKIIAKQAEQIVLKKVSN